MQIAEPEEQAERLAEMTNDTEELTEDDIATTSFLLDDLTESAIGNIEVNYSSICTLCIGLTPMQALLTRETWLLLHVPGYN